MSIDLHVYLCDKGLKPVTDPLPWTSIDATVRHLEPGSAAVTCPATSDVLTGLATGAARVAVVQYRGDVFLAGPVERPYGPYKWSAGPGEASGPGVVTFYASDYLALVAGRQTYPDPASAWSSQTAAAYYTDTGTASTVLLALVDANAGPSALTAPDRRVPGLVMGADPLAGPSVDVSTRFKPLLDEARSLVTKAGGAIGYRVVFDQATRVVTFEVYSTQDRTASVIFSRGLGNLREVPGLNAEVPRATTILVAGQGQGTARTTVERTDSTAEGAYWRLEEYRDARNDDTTALLEADGDERLAERAASVTLNAVPVDTEDQRYGVHYQLGDLVTMEPIPGLVLADTVRAARLTATPRDGVVVSPTIGAQAQSTSDPEWLRQSRDLARRLSTLEAI